MPILPNTFFDGDACAVARYLLGKVIRHKYNGIWLAARIIETEAYYKHERGSHASLGYTDKRKALFMPPGTIYMYYARGGDSLNVSCGGDGNAVLIKSAYAQCDLQTHQQAIATMQQLNPAASGELRRVKVPVWNQGAFNKNTFYVEDIGVAPQPIIQTTRLGIPSGRDEHLPYRFIDYEFAKYCSSNPLTKRGWREGIEYVMISNKN